MIKPDVAFSAEGSAELFLPYLDVYHSRDSWAEVTDITIVQDNAKPVPLFEYVYHEYIIFLGEYNLSLWESLGGHTYSCLALARTLIWGHISDYNMQEDLQNFGVDKTALEYLKKVAQARFSYARNFLVSGKMLPSPFTSSLQTKIISESNKYIGEQNALQYSAWKSPAGHYGLILTNISVSSVQSQVTITDLVTELSQDDSYTIIQYVNGVPTILHNSVKLPQTLDINLDSLDVMLKKIIPSGEVTAPVVSASKATEITTNSAILNGNLSNLGTACIAQVSFEFGMDINYSKEDAAQLMLGAGIIRVKLTGLNPNTEYHYRIKAIGDGFAYSIDSTFNTLPTEVPASSFSPTSELTPTIPLVPAPTTTPSSTSIPSAQEPVTSEKFNIWLVIEIIVGIFILVLLIVLVLRKSVH